MRHVARLRMMIACVALLAAPLSAQLAVPGVPVAVPPVGGVLGEVTDRLDRHLETVNELTPREARQLLRLRDRALDRLLRANPQAIERDAAGNLSRRGELLASGVGEADLRKLEAAGFRVLAREEVEGLGFSVVRLAVPQGLSLAEAQDHAAALAPGVTLDPDNLHFEAGASSSPAPHPHAVTAASAAAVGVKVGMIDGGSGTGVTLAAQKGFASGAPHPSDHGSAVASLLARYGAARPFVADVYGTDPAGGNALAIAKALGWLIASGCKVVTISLVGPRNGIVERAVRAAQAKGVVVVAAVGNDGPAAPPAYPASYDGVLAITGVDRKGRALIEAGRAQHLDYAAPGADVHALSAKGVGKVYRGTSFAAPLAAVRVAAAVAQGGDWRSTLDREARDLGRKGPDGVYGRGVLCEGCGKTK